MNLTADGRGQAIPLARAEKLGLIPMHIAFRHELDQAEYDNLARGQAWAGRSRLADILSERFLVTLHRRMFADVWRGAGRYRTGPRPPGVDPGEIAGAVHTLLDDIKFWREKRLYPRDEIALRFHHRLVKIQAFSRGNGRHGRLMADLLVSESGGARFTWGLGRADSPDNAAALPGRYITALRAADGGNLTPLLHFARW